MGESQSVAAGVRSTGAVRCILLAGGIRPSPLAADAGMHTLRLFPTADCSVLENWIHRLTDLHTAALTDQTEIELRVVFNTSRDIVENVRSRGVVRLAFEGESGAYRGPAGVVRDVVSTFGDDATVLIAEANRWLMSSLAPMLIEHTQRDADVTVARHEDGSPAGVYLARRDAFDTVNSKGFIDLKEQWLTSLRHAGRRVFVHTFPKPGAALLRTREDLLALAQRLSANGSAARGGDGLSVVASKELAPAESWSVVSSRASVDPSARAIGSVVMPGASIGVQAVVVRSVICPGAEVAAGEEIVDKIVRGNPAVASTMARRKEGN